LTEVAALISGIFRQIDRLAQATAVHHNSAASADAARLALETRILAQEAILAVHETTDGELQRQWALIDRRFRLTARFDIQQAVDMVLTDRADHSRDLDDFANIRALETSGWASDMDRLIQALAGASRLPRSVRLFPSSNFFLLT
jgi:hypothetical protein